MREIPLTRGKVAIVDDEDYDRLAAFSWIAKPAEQVADRWYAYRTEAGRTVYMHREIADAAPGEIVDHRDNDGLNNRRRNLRVCSRGQNNTNRRCMPPSSGFRGVQRQAHGQFYRARVEVDGLVIRVTGQLTAEQAARAYDAIAREFQGEFALLNFPSSERVA